MTIKYKTNTFYYLANHSLTTAQDESELQNRNLTEVFWKEIEAHITNHEIIIININAKPRLGKSTIAIKIGQEIHKLLKKHNIQPKNSKFNLSNIARDDQEYSEMMRNPSTNNTVIVIDESNELEKGGENATVEAQLKKVFTDVQAARYVHTVWCSPKEVANPNADIILEVYAKDPHRKKTLAKLYYRLLHGNTEYPMLLGYIEIDVKDLITDWESIRTQYYKEDQTPSEKKKIKETIKKDFYSQYIINKHYKIDLISKEFILRPRELPYAKVKLEAINTYKHLAGKTKITEGRIRNELQILCRQHKIAFTLVGKHTTTQEVMAILEEYANIYNSKQKIQQLSRKLKQNKISYSDYEEQILSEQELLTRSTNNLQKLEEELKHYEKVYNKYNINKQMEV